MKKNNVNVNQKDAKSQCKIILKFCMTHKNGITGQQAYRVAGSMCLPQRIYDLKKQGHEFTSEYVKVKCESGRVCRVKRYKLVQ